MWHLIYNYIVFRFIKQSKLSYDAMKYVTVRDNFLNLQMDENYIIYCNILSLYFMDKFIEKEII